MKFLLGSILFFLLFGWLGIAVAGVFIVKYFWAFVILIAALAFRGLIGGLADRIQGVPTARRGDES